MIAPLDLASQVSILQRAYPDAMSWLQGDEVHWHGTLQPTPASRKYRLRLSYRIGDRIPRCQIVEPGLHALVSTSHFPKRALPHVYAHESDPLCLFFGEEEWNAGMAIAETTVPWVSLWLRFFEVWLVTNTWEGSGTPHPA